VTSPSLCYCWWWRHPWQSYIRDGSGSSPYVEHYIRDSGKCLCDVTHKTRRAAHSYCVSRALWLVHRKRGADDGRHACKPGDTAGSRMTTLTCQLSQSRVCAASVRVYVTLYKLLNVFRCLC
jgi:hypothetical protein